MGTLYSFHIEIALAFLLQDSGISSVSQGARVSITHTSQVVFVTAECLLNSLGLEGAMAIVDDLPNGIVLDHVKTLQLFVILLLLFWWF